MGIIERLKGQPAAIAQPLARESKHVVEAPVHIEGAAVDLGDSAARLYKDKSGEPLGGGHREGQTYAGTMAENARKSVADHDAAELAALEKALKNLE